MLYGLISAFLNTGGPLLLMELAFLLRCVGCEVVWITNQKLAEPDQVIYSLENRMLDRGVQVIIFCFCVCARACVPLLLTLWCSHFLLLLCCYLGINLPLKCPSALDTTDYHIHVVAGQIIL